MHIQLRKWNRRMWFKILLNGRMSEDNSYANEKSFNGSGVSKCNTYLFKGRFNESNGHSNGEVSDIQYFSETIWLVNEILPSIQYFILIWLTWMKSCIKSCADSDVIKVYHYNILLSRQNLRYLHKNLRSLEYFQKFHNSCC